MKYLKINEIFHSIQGESTYAGRRCVFIRLAGCNINCLWCDTKYAQEEKGRELSIDMIIEAIKPYNAKLVEITGGEPLIQKNTPELAKKLVKNGYEVIIETNGTEDISVLPYPIVRIMDIKTPGSGEADKNRWENLVHLRNKDEVKFVISDKLDYNWAKNIIEKKEFPKNNVTVLFSANTNKLSIDKLAKWIVDDQIEVRINLQIHKFIWKNIERGV